MFNKSYNDTNAPENANEVQEFNNTDNFPAELEEQDMQD